ncbi:FAD-dependent oxidoreductase [Phycisphaerales bacterium AB-hyl4]|uniref:FAD-dependent oxidoreductase n=1 Tax=Natronomicrosphaera hydrolytica TaxID=3242702 RepID=A0ABV4U9L1_9BACT
MSNAEAPNRTLREDLTTPIAEQAGVVVCGGGPAGAAAAIAAAQTQRHLGIIPNVRLIETHGQLGGVWTSGLLSWILDARNKTGLMQQIMQRVEACRVDLGGRPNRRRGGQLYDAEHMKLLLEEMCTEAGVRLLLHTRVVAAYQQNGKLTHIVTESKSGREAFAASCFIDCTGDGDLAAQAGCSYDFGRFDAKSSTPPACQPMTLMAMITGVDRDAIRPFYDRQQYTKLEVKQAMRAEFDRAGVNPSYSHPTLFEVYPDLFALMTNHEYDRDPRNAQAVTNATIAARREIYELTKALRGLGDPWRDLRVVVTAAQIGIRESRRPAGLYRICLDDLAVGRRHDDAVCECSFPIDVHATSNKGDRSVEASPVSKTLPYDIPFRALVARDVDGLLMAGRCISGDFYAHSSYRVTGNAVPMGEAAGCAAALASVRGCSVRDLDYVAEVRPIQQSLFNASHVADDRDRRRTAMTV